VEQKNRCTSSEQSGKWIDSCRFFFSSGNSV